MRYMFFSKISLRRHNCPFLSAALGNRLLRCHIFLVFFVHDILRNKAGDVLRKNVERESSDITKELLDD
ncbi:hypothetical protein MUK42_05803 [Musa troglodytarum]|uniref:Uncharacterized protein n=1 Tax=Musa troglodytarum TaxID=320322 RepID=A0A9E7I1K6_9LILI|nr:hypothetical protein MUK42_05803 [Musa troglodytarum]